MRGQAAGRGRVIVGVDDSLAGLQALRAPPVAGRG
jgi:hypothetical protein